MLCALVHCLALGLLHSNPNLSNADHRRTSCAHLLSCPSRPLPRHRVTHPSLVASSPFEKDDTPSATVVPCPPKSARELTRDAADAVLDEVRPFLISDGGNVEVLRVDADRRNVHVVLQGACGSCPSSTVTLKNGIERVLRENFADLNEVIAEEPSGSDGAAAAGGVAGSSVLDEEAVISALAPLMEAITGLGGSVRVVSADAASGEVVLFYDGPPKLKFGIALALEDDPLITSVKFES